MKEHFDSASIQISKVITRKYSTSFSLGIHLLASKYRNPIYSIYGFVRLADEIVDSFHGYGQEEMLLRFRNETSRAIDERISLNPVLNAFQHVVHDYNIEKHLIDTFLNSMEMDLSNTQYGKSGYERYILGSAEVVGLMCLRVFTEGDEESYRTLKPAAMKLGSAFQKVNFLRDVKQDYETLGRSYFPDIDISLFNHNDKKSIEDDIESDFQEALQGILKLPSGARRGVYLAYIYYRKLFEKIKKVPCERLLLERIRVPNSQKAALMITSLFRLHLNLL